MADHENMNGSISSFISNILSIANKRNVNKFMYFTEMSLPEYVLLQVLIIEIHRNKKFQLNYSIQLTFDNLLFSILATMLAYGVTIVTMEINTFPLKNLLQWTLSEVLLFCNI